MLGVGIRLWGLCGVVLWSLSHGAGIGVVVTIIICEPVAFCVVANDDNMSWNLTR